MPAGKLDDLVGVESPRLDAKGKQLLPSDVVEDVLESESQRPVRGKADVDGLHVLGSVEDDPGEAGQLGHLAVEIDAVIEVEFEAGQAFDERAKRLRRFGRQDGRALRTEHGRGEARTRRAARQQGGADGLCAVGAGGRPLELDELAEFLVGSDVGEKRAVLLILNAQNLNVLQRGEGGNGLLQDAQVLLCLDELLLVVDLADVVSHVHQAKTVVERGEDLTDSLSPCSTRHVTSDTNQQALSHKKHKSS